MTLKDYGINELYYFSRIENFTSIAQKGIMAKNNLTGKNYSSFADEDVQRRRKGRVAKSSKGRQLNIHDYVPLYMTTLTPTQCARMSQEDSFFFLVLDSEIINSREVEFAFSDGNAGSNSTRFYNELTSLNRIDYRVVKARQWWKASDGKRRKNSEVLIADSIDFRSVKKIIVNNNKMKRLVENKLKILKINKRVEISYKDFFTTEYRGSRVL